MFSFISLFVSLSSVVFFYFVLHLFSFSCSRLLRSSFAFVNFVLHLFPLNYYCLVYVSFFICFSFSVFVYFVLIPSVFASHYLAGGVILLLILYFLILQLSSPPCMSLSIITFIWLVSSCFVCSNFIFFLAFVCLFFHPALSFFIIFRFLCLFFIYLCPISPSFLPSFSFYLYSFLLSLLLSFLSIISSHLDSFPFPMSL